MGNNNPNIGTLQKITYKNLKQFEDDVNSNFAVIQNSPLFKGVSGEKGEEGSPGIRGIRGSKFFVVDTNSFIKNFTDTITTGSQIDLLFLNEKLKSNTEKNKILNSLDTTNLVDNDIVVLTNSTMLMYKYDSDSFYNTGLTLNSNDSVIEEKIESMFENISKQYNSVNDIFKKYVTYSKDYHDNSNVPFSTSIKQTSIFAPFIEGKTTKTVEVHNHNYFGLSDLDTNKNNTLVIGNIQKYYDLLMNTISLDNNSVLSLNSSYAPGNNNIPSVVFLQDTTNNGIMFGYKNSDNIKSFGSIFKDSNDNIVIKSNSGAYDKLENNNVNYESTALLISKHGLRYTYNATVDKDLRIKENLHISGDINHNNLQTGRFVTDSNNWLSVNNQYLRNQTSIGSKNKFSNTLIHGENVYLTEYVNKILSTDNNGKVSKNLIQEDYQFPNITGNNFTLIPLIPTNPNYSLSNKIVSSYHLNEVIKRINILYTSEIQNLYWTKADFVSNIIPDLKLNNSLSVSKVLTVDTNKFVVNGTNNSSIINTNSFDINSTLVKFDKFKNKVLVTNNTGNLVNNVEIYDNTTYSLITNLSNNIESNNIKSIDSTKKHLIKLEHYNVLLKLIENIRNLVYNNYWSKNDFTTGEIPYLFTNNLFTKNSLTINSNLTPLSINNNTYQNNSILHVDSNNLLLNSNNIKFGNNSNLQILKNTFWNKVLFTENNGNLKGISLIGSLPVNNDQILSFLNNQGIADNLTISSFWQKIIVIRDNINNNIQSQINQLNNELQNIINNQISTINSNITSINNELNTHNSHIKRIIGLQQNEPINFNNVSSLKELKQLIDTLTNRVNNHHNTLASIIQTLDDTENVLSTLNSRIVSLEQWKENTVQLPKNAIILWTEEIGGIPLIPDGWEIVTDLMNRFPIGWSDWLNHFNENKKIQDISVFIKHKNNINRSYFKILSDEIPAHTHSYLDIYHSETGGEVNLPNNYGSQGSDNNNKGYQLRRTTDINNSPNYNISRIPPFYVVCYLRSKRGISVYEEKYFIKNANSLSPVMENSGNILFKNQLNGNPFNIVNKNNIPINTNSIQEFKMVVKKGNNILVQKNYNHTEINNYKNSNSQNLNCGLVVPSTMAGNIFDFIEIHTKINNISNVTIVYYKEINATNLITNQLFR